MIFLYFAIVVGRTITTLVMFIWMIEHMLAIVLGIAMFMLLVIIHELGHFTAAKKTGVKVMEFGIGIPPKAFRRWTDKDGTEYTINRLPL